MDRGGDLKITITGVNNATKVFDAVIDSAEKIGPALDEATGSAKKLKPAAEEVVRALDPLDNRLDDAGEAARETDRALTPLPRRLDETGQAARDASTSIDQSARSLGDYRRAAQDTVAGLAILGGAFTMYAGQARDHEMTIMAIRRMYGETADSYIAFAETIQNTTIFSNDEALAAARIMGTLKQNYDLTDRQIQQLIQTSADLASMHGFTLTDAAQRVSAAIRGEAESAEMLGLTMNQAAIDADNLTLSMSNAEAGAFRFDALMEQAASSMGAAAEAAETTTGKTQQLANQTQDAALAFVNFTGPVGDVAAGLGSFGLEAGLAVGGLAQLAKGMRGFRAAAGGTGLFSSLATVIGSSGASVGLAGAISAAGAAALIAAPAIVTLGGAVAYLALTQDDLMDTIDGQTDALTRWANSLGKGGEAYQELLYFVQDIRDMTTTVQEMDPFGPSLTVADTTLNSVLDELLQLTPETFRQLEASLLESGIAIGNLNNLTSDQLQLVYQLVLSAWAQQTEAAIAQATAIEQTTQAWMDYEQAQNQAAIAGINNAQAMEEQNRILATLQASQRDQALWSGAEPMAADVVDVGPWLMRFASMGQAIADMSALTAEGIVVQYDFVQAVLDSMPTMSDYYSKYLELTPAIEQAARATADFDQVQAVHSQLLGDTKTDLIALEDAYRELADSVRESMGDMNPASVLDSTFGGVVGAAQNFARLSESVWDWSNSLAEGNKESSTLNQLFRDGLISGKTYRDGLEANHRIMLANNSVQEDALRIQAKQLPLMADLAEQHAAYVDTIADMPAEQQLVSLGFLDQAKTAQALEIAQLAAASSSEAMQASTAAMILEIANADPQLKAMLISMGLLSETKGKLSVNFGEVDSANVAIENLTDAVNTFALVIAEAFGIDIVLNDAASGPLANILNTLNALDGKTSTVYVNTIGGGLTLGAMHGGVIDGYAGGGVVIEAAEAGPELLRYPNGRNVLAVANDYYSVPRGTSVLPAPATRDLIDRAQGRGSVTTYNGPVFQTVTLEQSRFAQRSHDLARSRNGRR